MSGRLLRKVLQEKDAEQEQQQQPVDSGDESDSPVSSVPAKNPFELLLDDEDNDDHQDLDEEDDLKLSDESTNHDGHVSQQSKEKVSAKPSSNKSKKKKKKKAKEDSQVAAEKQRKPPSNGKELEISDLALDDLSIRTAKSTNVNNMGNLVKQLKPSILKVDPKFLIAENELRRIFGSKVVNSVEKGHQAGNSRHSIAGRRGVSHSHRKSILVSPSDRWPRWDGSFSMELLESKSGVSYFRYVHSPSYGQAQRAFEAAKAIHDLNGVTSILLHHPYHVDSLITLAEYLRFSGEHQMAADTTAKCLYALECAWHPMFTPLQGNCQLKHSHDTNKPLFSTLFSHMKTMDRRGCHRSALEICKLLLSLDSDDPVGALFCIDYYALRAQEHFWLEQFAEEYGSDNSLWLFPNFSYSLAISRYYLEHKELAEGVENSSGKASSDDLMKQALMLHPSVLKKLVAKVPLKDQVWVRILENSFFKSEKSGSPSLDHLISLYVERSYLIWRLPELQKLLRDAASVVIASLKDNKSDVHDWACVRKEAFSSEKNEYSHLMLSDFSDAVPTLPPDELQNFMGNPMMGGVPNERPAQGEAAPLRIPRDLTNRNAIAVLLESLLPWTDYGEGGEDEAGPAFDENNDQAR